MSFAREGFVFVAVAAFVAAGTYALALNRRSWPLWLVAFGITVITLCVAYYFRNPERSGPRGEQAVTAPAAGSVANWSFHSRSSANAAAGNDSLTELVWS